MLRSLLSRLIDDHHTHTNSSGSIIPNQKWSMRFHSLAAAKPCSACKNSGIDSRGATHAQACCQHGSANDCVVVTDNEQHFTGLKISTRCAPTDRWILALQCLGERELSSEEAQSARERSLELLPRAVAATAIYARHIVDGDAVDPLANKPRILGDEVWSADSSLRRSDPG